MTFDYMAWPWRSAEDDDWTYVEVVIDRSVDPDHYQIRRTAADGSVDVRWAPFNAPLCATQAQDAAPAPAAPAPLTEDEAIDAAINLANTHHTSCSVAGDLLLEKVYAPLPSYAIWPQLDPRQHRRELAKFDGARFVRTVPYASPPDAAIWPQLDIYDASRVPWQLPEPCPDTVRSPEPEPEPKPCYYCQHPPGSHAPACIEVKYGHV